jgi:hypothetical protein
MTSAVQSQDSEAPSGAPSVEDTPAAMIVRCFHAVRNMRQSCTHVPDAGLPMCYLEVSDRNSSLF